MAKRELSLKTGDNIRLEITGITHTCDGVGRFDGMAVFVPGAVPGETVSATLVERKKTYARARLLEVIHPSPNRRKPDCPHYWACGGCHLQHLDYNEHLRLKTKLVRDSLQRIADLDKVPVRDTIGMDSPWNYRNKVHFQVHRGEDGLQMGFYEEGSHSPIALFNEVHTSVPGCLLVDKGLNEAAQVVEGLLNKYRPKPIPPQSNTQCFHHVMLRKSFTTGEVMVILVTGAETWQQEKKFTSELLSQRHEITSLYRNINTGSSGPILGKENRLLAGQPHIKDKLEDLFFLISPPSFFQVNPVQTLVLYRKALEYIQTESVNTPIIIDAYSGIGTIALFMAGQAKQVYGLEEVPEAVEDARRNAQLNDIKNVEFLLGKVENKLPEMATRGMRPDVIVLDPPRSGCRPEVLKAVADMETPRVVYISCDPGTLARDLKILASMGYRVEEVQPVDMFPWTYHVESIVLMMNSGLEDKK